jgi:hypothetical protein
MLVLIANEMRIARVPSCPRPTTLYFLAAALPEDAAQAGPRAASVDFMRALGGTSDYKTDTHVLPSSCVQERLVWGRSS